MVEVGFENFPLQQQPGALAFARDLDKSCSLQLFDVVGECGGRYRLTLAHIGAEDAFVFCANLLQDLVAPRISQGFRNDSYLTVR